jgi:hypothetical protein
MISLRQQQSLLILPRFQKVLALADIQKVHGDYNAYFQAPTIPKINQSVTILTNLTTIETALTTIKSVIK